MRTLTFQQIEDARFDGTKASLELKIATLLSKLESKSADPTMFNLSTNK
ncbi:hypothetical protein [Vibrio parahaemolyticus]